MNFRHLLSCGTIDVGLIPVVEGNIIGPEIGIVLLLGLFGLEVVLLLEVMVAEALDDDFKDSSFG